MLFIAFISLFYSPANSKEMTGPGALGQPLFQRFNKCISLFHDLVLDLEDFLPLAALLLFQFLYLLLNFMLLFERNRLARLPPQHLDLRLGNTRRLRRATTRQTNFVATTTKCAPRSC